VDDAERESTCCCIGVAKKSVMYGERGWSVRLNCSEEFQPLRIVVVIGLGTPVVKKASA
jgi:hypothetical protein